MSRLGHWDFGVLDLFRISSFDIRISPRMCAIRGSLVFLMVLLPAGGADGPEED